MVPFIVQIEKELDICENDAILINSIMRKETMVNKNSDFIEGWLDIKPHGDI